MRPVLQMRSGELFTFVEMSDERGGEWASTNNMIEGGVNARLREMLRMHRGLSTIRRIKAIFWWCYMHTEAPRYCASCRRHSLFLSRALAVGPGRHVTAA